MKYVSFYNDVKQGYFTSDKSGLPSIINQPRSEDKALLSKVAEYLDGGYQLGSSLGWSNDAFNLDIRTSLETMTDGEWVWPADASHYCKTYGILPPNSDFVKKIIERGGNVPKIDSGALDYIDNNWYKHPNERPEGPAAQ